MANVPLDGEADTPITEFLKPVIAATCTYVRRGGGGGTVRKQPARVQPTVQEFARGFIRGASFNDTINRGLVVYRASGLSRSYRALTRHLETQPTQNLLFV